jgi:hypothetical protein
VVNPELVSIMAMLWNCLAMNLEFGVTSASSTVPTVEWMAYKAGSIQTTWLVVEVMNLAIL